MEIQPLFIYTPPVSNIPGIQSPAARSQSDQLFQMILTEKVAPKNNNLIIPLNSGSPMVVNEPPPQYTPEPAANPNPMAAAAAYQNQNNIKKNEPQQPQQNGWPIYKDEQLLSNPGGDEYNADGSARVTPEKESFFSRIGKDLSDAFGNVKNFFGDLFFGAKVKYRDEQGEIQETRQKGLVGSIVDLVKDVGSALTLGAWRPDGEEAPQGMAERLKFAGSKLKEAVAADLIEGVGGSVNHMAEDLVLAGWNLVEVLPDATIGNSKGGQKIITNIFDNGQVAIDYLTDIMPFGEAWLRVHSSDLLKNGTPPVMYNLNIPEHYDGDERWEYISNTPFRKKIETVGSILADIFAVGVATKVVYPGDKRN